MSARRDASSVVAALALSAFAGALVHCGGDGDDGEAPDTAPIARISGRISSLETDETTDAPVAGIQTTASAAGTTQATTSDDFGDFEFPAAPSGNVVLSFVAGDCTRNVDVLAVVDGSTLTIASVRLDCRSAGDATFLSGIAETFRGVVRSIESSGANQVTVGVCVSSRGAPVVRRIRGVSTLNPEFDDFVIGDLVEIDGGRDFGDFPTSDVETANDIRVVARDQLDECG